MDILLTCVVIFLSIINTANGLLGSNVCNEQQNYTLTTRVKYQQPVSVRTYRWCFDIPPKCSTVHTEMRDKWKIQTETRTKMVSFCCPGFVEQEDKCNPKCPEGVTGDKCNEDCPPKKWGPSCSQECRCPRNSVCDPRNGKCVCMDGWAGSNCDVPKEVFTRVPSLQTPSTKINDSKLLFDWSVPVTVGPLRKTSTTVIPTTTTIATTTTSATTTTMATTTTVATTTTSTTTAPTRMIHPTTGIIIIKNATVSTVDMIENRTSIQQQINTTVNSIVNTTNSTALDHNTTYTTTETSKMDVNKFQIESPVPTVKTTYLPIVTDSPITVILHNISKTPSKELKPISRATESSIISLTVLKSTVDSPKKKPQKTIKNKQNDSELVKITLYNDRASKSYVPTTSPTQLKDVNDSKIIAPSKIVTSGTIYLHRKNDTPRSSTVMNYVLKPTQSTLDNNTFFTMVTTDIQTEEVKHVLTEPEQITSVAEDEEEGDRKDDLYSALSVGMGVAAALILVATVIVFVARYRRSYGDRTTKMDLDRVQSMINISEDEVTSGYLRSVFHSPLPEIPITTTGTHSHKSSFEVPFIQPVVIHTISPILMESFKEVLESHYDHPKPPRPASVTISTNLQKNVTFGTLPSSFRPQNSSHSQNTNHVIASSNEVCFPVTEEAINTLKLEQYKSHTLEMENTEPIYDEIPWRPITVHVAEFPNNGDEAITEL